MPIEFACDRCQQELKVPDDWAGRRVRCRGCNRVLSVPDPLTGQLDSSFDVKALAGDKGEPEEELVTDFAPIPRAKRRTGRDGEDDLQVTCPHCGKVIKVQDPYSEILCSSCWEPVPPLEGGDASTGPSRTRGPKAGAFYDQIISAFGYPLDATGSILLGMLVAGGAILLPVGMVLTFVMGVALNPITPSANVSWVPMVLAALFAVEAIYFAGMAYSALLDAARNTVAENDKAPDLVWNPASVGSGIVGYVTLVIVYGAFFLGVNYLTSGGQMIVPTSVDQARQLMSPVTIVILVLLTFTVPMVIVGLAMMPGLEGLSPGRIIRSIAATIVHYLFLFVVVCFMLGIYLGIMSGVTAWAIETLMTVLRKGIDEGFSALMLGLLAWTVLIGSGFYCALMIGRLHGLFARTFRSQLAFE